MHSTFTPVLAGPIVLLLMLPSCSPSSATPGGGATSDAGGPQDGAGAIMGIPIGAPDGSPDAPGSGAPCSPPTSLACNGACVDPTMPSHCGACGNACAAPAAGTGSATCVDGTCGTICNAGYAQSGSNCVATDLYVSVATGSDSNPGTLAAPLQTIRHALGLAQGSTAVHVFAGTYSEWSASNGGLLIRDGVTVESYGSGMVILEGPGMLDAGSSQAVAINDSGTLRGVTIQGYDVPIVVSGSGSALLDSVNTVDNQEYTDVMGTGTLTAVNSQLGPVATATVGGSTPTFIMQSGTLTGTGACGESGEGPLLMYAGSTVALTGVTIDDSGPAATIYVSGSVTMTNTTINAPTCDDGGEMVIYQAASPSSPIRPSISSIDNEGILTMNGGSTSESVLCEPNSTGQLPALVMRNVTVAASTDIVLNGPGAYDLGNSYSPGGNTFSLDGPTEGFVIQVGAPDVTMTAAGNTWIPGLQGADASGHTVSGTSLAGPLSCPTVSAPGCNFYLPGATDSITF